MKRSLGIGAYFDFSTLALGGADQPDLQRIIDERQSRLSLEKLFARTSDVMLHMTVVMCRRESSTPTRHSEPMCSLWNPGGVQSPPVSLP